MKQPYFVVVLAHSLHGRLRRVHIPQQALYAVLMLAVLGCFTLVIVVSSYARMAWKMASYNSLRKEAASVRAQYNSLNKEFMETKGQLAALQLFASEVSNAYGIKRRLEGPSDISSEGRLVPTYSGVSGGVQLPEERERLPVPSLVSDVVAGEGQPGPVAG